MNLIADHGVATQSHDDDSIDLLEYWAIVRRRWRLMAGTALATAFVALVFTLLATPVYRAGTTLQIERDTIKVVSFDGLQPTESPLDRDFYQTQYELLRSRSLARRVIEDLKLAADPLYGKYVEAADEDAEKRNDGAPLVESTRRELRDEALVDPLLESLGIEPVRNSRLVRINFDSPDPQLAAKVANAYAAGFIASNLERRFQASSYAKKYLEERLAQLKDRLEDSERQLVAFSEQEQIVSVSDDKPSLDAQSLGDLNAALAVAQAARTKAEALWRGASIGDGMGLPQVVANPLIQKLREQRAGMEAKYQNSLATFKPDYPDMMQLQQQIAETNRQIGTEVSNIRRAVRIDYEAALSQEELLKSRVRALKGDVLNLQGRSIQYNILKRETEKNRQLYDALLQRYKEIGVAGGIGANNISVIDAARPPTKAGSPRKLLNLAIGTVLGVFLGVLVVFVVHFLDNTVRDPKALEMATGLAVLGAIPRLAVNETPLTASSDLRSPFSEAYRSVRTALQLATTHGLSETMLITSAGPSEGKSTSALELAQNIAQIGKRVLLVDADLRDGSVHVSTGLSSARGLSSLLSGACSPGESIQAYRNFSVITAGPLPPNPPELLGGDALPKLLGGLRKQFDVILLDGPPILGLADAPLLASHAEATMIVVAAQSTRIEVVQAAIRRMQFARARLIGAVLTYHDAASTDYYGYTDGHQAPRAAT